MLPQMGAKPGAADRERSPGWSVHRRGHPPEIGVLMEYPTAATVMLSGYLRPLICQFRDHFEEWSGTFRKVAGLCRPVIHFRIDIGRVFGIPHRIRIIVPDPLQIGGLTAGTR